MGYLRFAENVEYAHMDIQDSAGFVCDPQKMNQLESSCRNVVRQCTFSLKTNSSSSNVQQQQFALAEADLIKSLCSYLSCEHYNSDLFVDESSVSFVDSVYISSLFKRQSLIVTQSADNIVLIVSRHLGYWILCLLLFHLDSHSVCLFI